MFNIQLTTNLRRLRKEHDLRQAQIAEKLNISRQAYSNYETGKRIPDLDMLVRISEIYGVTLEQLLTQTCTKDGVINEITGPFAPGIVADAGSAVYLSEDEIKLILQYRNADEDDRRLTRKILKL